MKHDAHTQFIMRDTDSFYVRICGCGVVHLCFGATTLNLSEQAVIAVSETLREVSVEILTRSRAAPKQQESLLEAAQDSTNVIQGQFSKHSVPGPNS